MDIEICNKMVVKVHLTSNISDVAHLTNDDKIHNIYKKTPDMTFVALSSSNVA